MQNWKGLLVQSSVVFNGVNVYLQRAVTFHDEALWGEHLVQIFSAFFFFSSFGLLSCVPATFSVLWGKCESMPELVDFLYPSHQGFWAMQRSDVTRGKHTVAFYLRISLKQSMHGIIEAPLSLPVGQWQHKNVNVIVSHDSFNPPPYLSDISQIR